MSEFLTVKEFAKCLRIHYNTVRNMIKKGRIHAFKIGNGKTSDFRIPITEINHLGILGIEESIKETLSKRDAENSKVMENRFLAFVEKTNACWIWKGAVSSRGYGNFRLYGKQTRSHRASYLLFKGEIPNNQIILHSCDNPLCVNPDHLNAGTYKQNMDDREQRKRWTALNGEKSHAAKLSNTDIKEIILMRKNKVPAKKIAQQFNICPAYVYELSYQKHRKS